MDLVYLYCDDADIEWHNKRKKYQPQTAELQAVCDGRFVQNDELKYSLRSVAKYFTFVRRIFIVSDHQTPAWLNTDHPKITMVNHEEIINPKYLPLFNSSAIETALACIPGLDEYFAYMNDDMFIYRPLKITDFLHNGRTICRICANLRKKAPTQYEKTILVMQKLAEQTTENFIHYFPHHNLDVYRKKDFIASVKRHQKLVETTLSHRFRTGGDWQRSIVSFEAINSGEAEIKVVNRYKESFLAWLKHNFIDFGKRDSLVLSIQCQTCKKKLRRAKPLFFCLEDNEYAKPEDRLRGHDFLEKLYPEKSEFEK